MTRYCSACATNFEAVQLDFEKIKLDFWNFLEKCHFLGEFSRISGSRKSLAVCTTVVQLGILPLRPCFCSK